MTARKSRDETRGREVAAVTTDERCDPMRKAGDRGATRSTALRVAVVSVLDELLARLNEEKP